ncbi:MAG TPA: squalene/phytoene synthase family protein, partial [Dongiaceae bacterium]
MTDMVADQLQSAIAAKVQASGTSFYSAMRLLPPDRRNAMYAIYAFCREVDDIADEGDDLPAKRRELQEWRAEIDRLYAGAPGKPVAQALLNPVQEYRLRKQDFLAVIDGMEMDAEAAIQAPDLKTLDLYCDRVA